MPYETYKEKRFSADTRAIIDAANEIIAEYLAQGFKLTLRQLYYQFVSRDMIENTAREYNRLGTIINNGRLAGMIDWEAIEDRTRNVIAYDHWEKPEDIIRDAAGWYRVDRWKGQSIRPEVWIEKDALVGVLEKVCQEFDVPLFSCRGYTSQSEMWNASKRFDQYLCNGQIPFVIHLGDHDPSGIDMTRDIEDRTKMFLTTDAERFGLIRIALNFNQIEKWNPPPNFAKITDTRARKYIREYGKSSWELDALEPSILVSLVTAAINGTRNKKLWNATMQREKKDRERLLGFALDKKAKKKKKGRKK